MNVILSYLPATAIIVVTLVTIIVIALKQTDSSYYPSRADNDWRCDWHYDWRDLNEPAPSPSIGYTSHDTRAVYDCTDRLSNVGLLSALRARWIARGELHAPTLTGDVKRVDGTGQYKPQTDLVTRYLSTAPSGDKVRFVLAGDRLVFMTKVQTDKN